VNHQPESRMREIRPYGSEGGGTQANGLPLPLSSFAPFGARSLSRKGRGALASLRIRVGRWHQKRRNPSEECSSPTESRHSYEMVGPGVELGCPLRGSSTRGLQHFQSGSTPSREIVSLRGFNVDRATPCSGNTGTWEMVAPWAARRTNCVRSTPR
jgi:hypothetical protein